jgi:hypothetical protein
MNDWTQYLLLLPIFIIAWNIGAFGMRFLFRLSESSWAAQQERFRLHQCRLAHQERVRQGIVESREPYTLEELDRMIQPFRPSQDPSRQR